MNPELVENLNNCVTGVLGYYHEVYVPDSNQRSPMTIEDGNDFIIDLKISMPKEEKLDIQTFDTRHAGAS